MASPIVIAAALARTTRITCPWCKHVKVVERRASAFRVCPRCKKQFPDPLSPRRKR
jgi:hypothetical protein